jgi:hypothetical protein
VWEEKGACPFTQEISGISSFSLSFCIVVLKVREGEERRGAWREQAKNWEENL